MVADFVNLLLIKTMFIMAPSPSGKAKVCKTFITSSNLVGASNTFYSNPTLFMGQIINQVALVIWLIELPKKLPQELVSQWEKGITEH